MIFSFSHFIISLSKFPWFERKAFNLVGFNQVKLEEGPYVFGTVFVLPCDYVAHHMQGHRHTPPYTAGDCDMGARSLTAGTVPGESAGQWWTARLPVGRRGHRGSQHFLLICGEPKACPKERQEIIKPAMQNSGFFWRWGSPSSEDSLGAVKTVNTCVIASSVHSSWFVLLLLSD